MQEKEYATYGIEDFVWDEEFRKWVNEPSALSDKFWNDWVTKNPGKQPAVSAAKQIVQSLNIKEERLHKEEINKEIDLILNNVDKAAGRPAAGNNSTVPAPPEKIKTGSYFLSRRIAAVFILLLGIGAVLYYSLKSDRTEMMEVASEYGAIKKVVLPDSSTVVLNGNSSINYSKQWTEDQPREIWLNGEGFFTVRHLNKTPEVKAGERFLVHVKDITVEVLGTTFDIRQRRNTTVIVLSSGSIRVSYADGRSPVIMKPGEMVTLSDQHKDSAIVSTTEPKDFTAWTEKKLIANNASVKEIFHYLEDNYGKKIQLNDSSILDRKIQGPILLDNLDDALFVLSKVLNVKINNTDTAIIIETK